MFTLNIVNDSLRTTSACADFIEIFKNNDRSEPSPNMNAMADNAEDDLMDVSIASFDMFDPSIIESVSTSTGINAMTPHQQIPQITSKIDLVLSSLEPKPLSGSIQRVAQLPLSACLSEDLLKNCNDYCAALKSLNTNQQVLPLASANPRRNSNPTFSFASLGISCPKPGVPRSYSETSAVSHSPNASISSSDVVHIYDYQQERWMDRYQQLSAFFQAHGHSDVSNEFDSNLAGWVRRQRHQFKRVKQGRRSTLTVHRVQLLEQVGFKWDFHDLAWNENFERLKAFYKIHNHCNVPTSSSCSTFFGTKEENDRLLNWCKRQKRAIRMYLKNKDAVGSRMNARRFELLQSIRFRWQPVKKSEGA